MKSRHPVGIANSREPHLVAIDSVKSYDRHARRHSKTKIEKLKKLLGHYGQVAPIIVDDNNVIISGHALHAAMRELGAGEIAAVSIAGRSKSEINALRLALNRLPLEASWDNENLRAEFQQFAELSFDLELTGFDAPEIDQILELDLPQLNVAEDEAEVSRGACKINGIVFQRAVQRVTPRAVVPNRDHRWRARPTHHA